MCRHLSYVGAPVALAHPLLHAPHALVHQACTPRHQVSGRTNPDGYGVAWYVPGVAAPRRYRTAIPIWEDDALETVVGGVSTPAFVAAARLASPGAPVEESGNAPFVSGPWSFSLNGFVEDFAAGVGDDLRRGLSVSRRDGIEGQADTEVLFAMVLDRLDAGAAPRDALTDAVHAVEAHAGGRLNCILGDGHEVVATAVGNSLFARPGWAASEPVDDCADWQRVPDRSIVRLAPGAPPCTEPL